MRKAQGSCEGILFSLIVCLSVGIFFRIDSIVFSNFFAQYYGLLNYHLNEPVFLGNFRQKVPKMTPNENVLCFWKGHWIFCGMDKNGSSFSSILFSCLILMSNKIFSYSVMHQNVNQFNYRILWPAISLELNDWWFKEGRTLGSLFRWVLSSVPKAWFPESLIA